MKQNDHLSYTILDAEYQVLDAEQPVNRGVRRGILITALILVALGLSALIFPEVIGTGLAFFITAGLFLVEKLCCFLLGFCYIEFGIHTESTFLLLWYGFIMTGYGDTCGCTANALLSGRNMGAWNRVVNRPGQACALDRVDHTRNSKAMAAAIR